MNHFAVHLKLAQYCKSTVLPKKTKTKQCGLTKPQSLQIMKNQKTEIQYIKTNFTKKTQNENTKLTEHIQQAHMTNKN